MMAYQPEPRTRFRSLVLGQYVDAHAMSPSTALTLISVRSGVSLGALWSAFRSFRVSPEVAGSLRDWAYTQHGVEDLDVEHLVMAPKRPRPGRRCGAA